MKLCYPNIPPRLILSYLNSTNFRVTKAQVKLVYTDVLQNWAGEWSAVGVVAASPKTVSAHGKERG